MVCTKVVDETHDVRTFTLEWPQGVDYKFITGQFITVWFPHDPAIKRAYSLSSCELDRGFFDITVKKAGNFGTRLWTELKVGMKLMVIEPVGKFNLPADPTRDVIMIAGGSGITPFRGFVRHATKLQPQTRLVVIYSARVPSDIIFNDEFRKLEAVNPNFTFVVTCTRVQPEHHWTGRTGRVSEALLREFTRNLQTTEYYTCGPTELVEAIEQTLLAAGTPKAQVHAEKWG
jgi:ferredoxin-NADP reductase